MPMDKDELKRKVREQEPEYSTIEDILSGNPDTAYTIEELFQELDRDLKSEIDQYLTMLETFNFSSEVKSDEVDGTTYYYWES